MLEKYLIDHCAPTLASLKTASMFCMSAANEKEVQEQLRIWNHYFQEKGLFLTMLRRREDKALIYLCRRAHLQADLQKTGVASFLYKYGYKSIESDAALENLKQRLNACETFPHEIGIFLGYPLGDVIGFIQNEGKNSKCTGSWKVYCNENEAVKLFANYKKCRDVYARLWTQGRTIRQLTVAV